MASTSAGGHARAILVLFVAVFFVVDVVLLVRVVRKERRLAMRTEPESAEQTESRADEAHPETDGSGSAYETLRKEHAALRREAGELGTRVKQLEDEGAALRRTVETRFADREALRSEAAKLSAQLAETKEALDAASNDLAATSKHVKTLEGKLKAAADLVAKLNTNLRAAGEATAAEKEHADTLQKSLDEANQRLEAAKKAIVRKANEVSALKIRVKELEKQLGAGEGAERSGEDPGQ